MIRDYATSKLPTWRLVAEEVLGMTAAAALYPLGWWDRARPTARQREQRTVVLVHGYMANPSTLLAVEAALRLAGCKQVLAYGYRSGEGVEAAARGLRAFLRRNVRGGRIDLVCHSLGGLVARTYLQELGGARRVDRCVTLGTPHHGTYNAYWLASRVGRELRPDSELLERLARTREAAEDVRFLSVVAGADNLVVPRVFARHEQEVHVPDVGHVGMLFSPRVLRIVTRFLAEPLGRPATPPACQPLPDPV